jgi:cellulose synthase/poly-beta-1,6-N-acetylglucosamine synthase-like glycosyltransferase
MGLSSALSGSGMAFDFNWFRENIKKVSSVGEDKELEMWLLLDKIHIDFLNYVLVLDEKVQTKAAFSNQRKRWIAAQYEILGRALKHLPRAIREGNLDFIDKVFQWIMPPRVILLGLVLSISILATFVSWRFALKWDILCGVLAASLWIAIPKELRGRQLRTAIFDIPYLFLQMLLNMFRVKRNSQSFIHTKHGDS